MYAEMRPFSVRLNIFDTSLIMLELKLKSRPAKAFRGNIHNIHRNERLHAGPWSSPGKRRHLSMGYLRRWVDELSSPQLRTLRRIVYAASLSLLLTLLVVMVYNCLRFFFQSPTYFNSEIMLQRDAAFPSITFCPEPNGYNLEVLQVK